MKMGGDCCGGSAAADPASIQAADAAQAQLADMHVTDAQPAASAKQSKTAANGITAQPIKPDADVVKEKQPYFQKRIQLFEEYRKRELQKIEDAKQANVPIKGAHVHKHCGAPEIVPCAHALRHTFSLAGVCRYEAATAAAHAEHIIADGAWLGQCCK